MGSNKESRQNENEGSQDSVKARAPSDLLKPYYFGCGPFHPKWLQVFADKKFFTFLACCFTCIHSLVVSGCISVILSTLETRYRLNSLEIGFIIIVYDVSVAIGITFAAYFGSEFHKPRVLGIGCLCLGVTGFIFASPQFLFGRYESGTSSVILNEYCGSNSSFSTTDCSSLASNTGAYAIFIVASMSLSISASVLYTLTISYIDEIVYPKFVSLHIGTFSMFLVLGPAVGYLLGSACLTVYVDPWIETSLKESDPSWVGAWWIPFVLVGFSSLLLSIPFFMFPKWLPDSYLVRVERRKEMAKVYDEDYQNEKDLWTTLKAFPIHVRRALNNRSFIFASFGMAVIYIFIQGLLSFGPKYVENQFYLTSSTAGFVTGGIAIPASVLGILFGSFLLYVFKWNGKQNIIAVSVTTFSSLPFLLTFVLYCPTTDLAGVTIEYTDGSVNGVDSSVCTRMCSCNSTVFEPVCGSDGITYFSACRAGCSVEKILGNECVYENCTCIAETLYNVTGLINSTAIEGTCESTCLLIFPAIILFIIAIILAFTSTIPYQYFTLRVVSDEQRALALGLQSAILRIFGAVPGPLLFGALLDLACAMWQQECGHRGNCWIYHNDRLSIYVTSLAFPCIFIGGLLFTLAAWTYPKHRNDNYDESKELISQDDKE